MTNEWPKSSATNATASVEGTFSIDKLKAAMRKLYGPIPDDVIAVSMLFLPNKALEFVDDKGKIYAMSLAMWRRLEVEAQRSAPIGANNLLAGSPFRSAVGIPVVFDGDGPNWHRACDRIVRCIEAGREQHSFVERLRLEAKLFRDNSGNNSNRGAGEG